MPIDQAVLASFCGDLERTRHWLRVLLMTPDVLYVGENGGIQGAMWLVDAIASYQADRRIAANEKLRAMQFWTLRVQIGICSSCLGQYQLRFGSRICSMCLS